MSARRTSNWPARALRDMRAASCALALLAACATSSCNDPAANATVLDLTVLFDDALAIDQLVVSLSVEGGDAFEPFTVPDAPRALDGAGETVEILLSDDVGGATLVVNVDGLAAGDVKAARAANVVIEGGARTPLTITLAAPGPGDVCGDGAVEGTEECDDENGTAGDGCSIVCTVESGFVCTGAPSVCAETCGDGSVDDGEACDDGDLTAGDGCDDTCAVEPGFVCDDAEPSACAQTCGDGTVDDGEACDDGALETGDGCDDTCAVETGFVCDDAEPSVCAPACGDGLVTAPEGCDDDDTTAGDGCDDACAIEPGFVCTGAPSVCAETCNNGQIDPGEDCDDGGLIAGDGCSSACILEDGFVCDQPGSPCTTVCGDGFIRGTELCDDTGTSPGDGCDAACAIEPAFACTGEPSLCAPACTIGGVVFPAGAPDPLDVCRGCQPGVDAAAFTAFPDGSPCADADFCNGAETCQGGACLSPGDPCPDTQPFCSEAADICACTPASCDNGSFCDGDETCLANGNCADGAVPSCTGLTDVCSNTFDACVECEDDGDCSAPNPSCFTGAAVPRCTECPGCPCRSGEHDGGTGTCLPLGQCSPGFARGFLDADLDGTGAGPQLADCDVLPFAAGVSSTSTDCDDGDNAVFRVLTLFPDSDGDGFTLAGSAECIGAAVPNGFRQTASPPPFVSFQAATVTELAGPGNADWESLPDVIHPEGEADVTAVEVNGRLNSTTDFTDPLSITNFDPRVPATATVVGVAVHIVRRTDPDFLETGAAVDRTVQLAGVGVSANRASATPWPTGFTEAVYGGPTDLWGVALTPALVNATTFGVIIEAGATNNPDNVDAQIDHVWIEVFTNAAVVDCNDASATTWTLRASAVDVDVDRFTVGAESNRCVGVALPAGVTQRLSGSADCFDTNANARPGQTGFFSSNRGDGSFDYNCDLAQSKQTISEPTLCSCTIASGNCAAATSSTFTPSQNCGTSAPVDICVDDGQCIVNGTDIGCTVQGNGGSSTVRCR